MIKATYNEGLEKFAGVNIGKSAALFATGPSLSIYSPVHFDVAVGVNSVFNKPDILNILTDYFFGSSYEYHYKTGAGCEQYRSKIKEIPNRIQKFSSVYREGKETGRGNITALSSKKINAIPFETNLTTFATDVSKYSMLGHSIVFPALQFLLFTGIKKLTLIGCDATWPSEKVYIHNEDVPEEDKNEHYVEWWEKFKDFKDENYPDVEIISKNPMGLRGLFTDVYTE